VSAGRTSWWAKDAAWHRRELQVELGDEFGAAGPHILDVLSCWAQEQKSTGLVRGGFRALGREGFVDAETTRRIIEFAAGIGALDDLEVDDDGRRFTCRVSGFRADQERGRAAWRQASKRERDGDDDPGDAATVPVTDRDKSRPVTRTTPPDQTRPDQTDKDSPAVPKAVVARESAGDARNGEDSLSRVVDDVVGILQRGIDSIPGDQPMKRPTALAIRTALTNHPVHRDTAVAVAMEARAIAQSQDRAPNIAALFEQKLAARSIGRAA
jgi:hypothetical protein